MDSLEDGEDLEVEVGEDSLKNQGEEREDQGKAEAKQKQTRPDTRLPKSRAGGQGPYLRSSDCLGRSREVKVIKS